MTLDLLSYAATEQPLQAGDPALRARLRCTERSNVIIRDCVLYDDDCSVILPTLHGIDAVVTYFALRHRHRPAEYGRQRQQGYPATRFAISDRGKRPISTGLMNLVLAKARPGRSSSNGLITHWI
jgi:hypothetical protein